ncbi:MFS transporter [Pantoea sp. Cy-640]|uniref:MFS transporter n=1 Tax=Pantoea sp. Cy-640 TaxID=2608353 RepID=UPI0014197C29|nr:MFS transporter [Pantoea sp. Cy-640]NIG14095.1 MFS transporter [Pantoea sp. Cy-640]
MMNSNLLNLRQQRATRTLFFIAGLGMAAWAPLIPFAKAQLAINDGMLGLLLFCIAAGSMSVMPFTGALIAHFGCRTLLLLCGAGLALDLPLLMLLNSPLPMAGALLLFGAINGLMDVSMNYQAVIVEREAGASKMSGFHGFYSLGSIAGAGAVSLLLWLQVAPLLALLPLCVLILLLLLMSHTALLPRRRTDAKPTRGTLRALTHRNVVLIALLCFLLFLTEGAMLDWSAVFMNSERAMSMQLAGFSFTLYATAVATLRLFGDRLINHYGSRRVLTWGGLVASGGLALAIFSVWLWSALLGFVLVGIGLANIVPILFNAAGNQRNVAAHYAIPAVTLCGYSGLLLGPALIGFSAQLTSLTTTLSAGIVMLLLVTFAARFALTAK